MYHDPTMTEAAYREALRLGMTCRSCSQWDRQRGRELCKLEKEQFPRRICRDFDYEPGADIDTE